MSFEDTNDEDLMMLYKSGDSAAFRPLYDRHRRALFRFVMRQVSPAAVAEEIFQDVWLRVIKSAPSYEVQAKFSSYLYRITHNRIIDHYRSNDSAAIVQFEEDRFRLDFSVADTQLNADADMGVAIETIHVSDQVHQDKQIEKLRLSLNNLPAPQREVFLLKEESGLSLAEIALVIGCGAETAKSRYRYAVKKIRQDFYDSSNVVGASQHAPLQNTEGPAE